MSIRKLVKKLIPKKLFKQIEPYGHLAESVLWNIVYGFPGRGMKVIGITGTNGKTTTSYLVHHMLVEAGYNAGLMTTVAYGVGKDIKSQIQHYTNVPSRQLMQRLKAMRAEGMDWLVLETTSQALVQFRTWGVPYSVAVMTNVTHEHLDYHKTYENYVAAKKKLFQLVEHNKTGLQVGIANADDAVGEVYAGVTSNPLLYGIENGEIRAEDIKLSATGVEYRAVTPDASYMIKSSLAGSFNVYNTLAAICVGRTLGLTKQQIEQGIASLRSVEGRMVTIDEGQDWGVIVDFAHTPDSFEKVLSGVRPTVAGKIVVVFGSAGRRDEAKRAVQGEIAGRFADELVLTEEDDRDIDGNEILRQIADGAEKSGKKVGENVHLVLDRTAAIHRAMEMVSSKDDLVILLGKGHEKTIERADGTHPWDEVGTARDAIKAALSK